MLFQTFIATFGLLMPLVLAAPVSEENKTLANFTSHLKSRGLITAENTCPKSETCGVISYTGDRVVNLPAGECGILPESEYALSVYVANCYCTFWETCDSVNPKNNKPVAAQMMCQQPRMIDTFKNNRKPKYFSCGPSWGAAGLTPFQAVKLV